MKKFIILFLVFFIGMVSGIPYIDDIDDDFLGSSSVILRGNDFGIKAIASPIKWDNFEWGDDGVNIEDGATFPIWQVDGGGGPTGAKINITQKHGGTKSAYANLGSKIGTDNCAFYNNYISFAGGIEAYVSYWIWYESITGLDLNGPRADFFKFNRINSGGDAYGGQPSFMINLYPDYSFPETGRIEVHQYWDGGEPGNNIGRLYDNDMRQGEWHRIEMYLKLSNPGGATNGELQWFLNGQEVDTDWSGNTFTPGITRAEGSVDLIDTFTLLFAGCGYDQNNYPLIWQDDIYVDNTRARVEIGNALNWADCTHREIQVPTFWSDDFINVTFNRGSFVEGDDVYLFVVDKDGVVNEEGYHLVVGEDSNFSNESCEGDVDCDGANSTIDCDDNDSEVWSEINCSWNGSVCGEFLVCGECPELPSEVCGDGFDQDCDGSIDEMECNGTVVDWCDGGEDLECGECHEADTSGDCDGVDTGELGEYLERWARGEVSMGDVLGAVGVWRG